MTSVTQLKRNLAGLRTFRPLVRLVDFLQEKLFDWQHEVQTCGIVALKHLTIRSDDVQHGCQYEPTHPKAIAESLASLEIDYRRYVFVDFGSGKGRVLLLASEYPFKKIIGVEFARELHEVAMSNIRRYRTRTQRCREIQSVLCSAAEFEIPREPSIFFFFNPFAEPVMTRVLCRIQNSLNEHPRQVILVCFVPFDHTSITRLTNMRLQMQTRWYNIYRSSEPLLF